MLLVSVQHSPLILVRYPPFRRPAKAPVRLGTGKNHKETNLSTQYLAHLRCPRTRISPLFFEGASDKIDMGDLPFV